jgi:uncharacterized phage protein (TIGR02220 family)
MISIVNHNHAQIAGITTLEYLIADWIAQETACQKRVTSLTAIADETNISVRIVGSAVHNLISQKFLEKKGRDYKVTLQWYHLSRYGIVNEDDKLVRKIETSLSSHKELAQDIIQYLNILAGRSFDTNSTTYLKVISQIMTRSPKLGFKQFKAVIDLKYKQWGDDPEMEEYIRPQTLFQTKKFFLYLEEARESYITEKKGLNRSNNNII